MSLPASRVKLSISKLQDEIEGKKLALMMNNSAFTNEGLNLIDVMYSQWKADIHFLLGMEHGVRGELQPGVKLDDQLDPVTGLPVVSLYNFPGLRPPLELLSQVDAVVFCAQDSGIRHWTFTPWMMYAMDSAAKVGTEVIVVDRPNPINSEMVEGGVTEEE
jgi:uncharacterized protein YbbC (DUF1343 family)